MKGFWCGKYELLLVIGDKSQELFWGVVWELAVLATGACLGSIGLQFPEPGRRPGRLRWASAHRARPEAWLHDLEPNGAGPAARLRELEPGLRPGSKHGAWSQRAPCVVLLGVTFYGTRHLLDVEPKG